MFLTLSNLTGPGVISPSNPFLLGLERPPIAHISSWIRAEEIVQLYLNKLISISWQFLKQTHAIKTLF